MLDRKLAPDFVQSRSIELLKPEIHTLNSGCQVLVINGGNQEVTKLEFIFRASKWNEPHPGISHFTSALLPKGTPSSNTTEIDSKFDFYGIHIEIQPGFDFTSVSLYGLSKNIPFVLELLFDIFLNANFPEAELQMSKDSFRQALKINLEKTSFLASREFRKKLFGVNHPYGYDVELSDVDQIQRDQLIGFHKNYFQPFKVILSGKIENNTCDLVLKMVKQITQCNPTDALHQKAPAEMRSFHIEKKDAIQSSLRIGKTTVERTHPDYAHLLLFNQILGGYFGSRLMKNIREEKGLTYSIHSSIYVLKRDSYFVIGADVNSENRELVIQEIKNEIDQLKKIPISKEELEIARNHFIGTLQSELNTPFAHAEKIKMINMFDLPTTYFQNLIFDLFDSTPNQLVEFANTHFSGDNFYIVSAG